MELSHLLMPVITTFIGWSTNVLAVKMLFHPRKKINLLFTHIQGVIPSRQADLAASIAEIFDSELLSTQELVDRFSHIDFTDEAMELLQGKLSAIIDSFIKKVPMAAMVLNESLRKEIQDHAAEHFTKMIPEFRDLISKKVLVDYNLKEFLEAKIQDFSLDQLEGIIMKVATKELKTIEYLGGLIGLIIGLIQLAFHLYFH